MAYSTEKLVIMRIERHLADRTITSTTKVEKIADEVRLYNQTLKDKEE